MATYTTSAPNVAVDILIASDHDLIRALYNSYKTAISQEKHKFANEFIRQIAVHSHAEEIIVYPALEARLVRGTDAANHSRSEHLRLKHELYRLDKMNPNHPQFESQIDRCMDVLTQHMKEEEEEILPQLKRSCWEAEMVSLGEQFQRVKDKVPTHPHPWAPDRPPMESIIGMMQAPIDKAYDALSREFPSTLPSDGNKNQ